MRSVFLLIVICFFSNNLIGQDSNIEQKTLNKNGLQFNYPSDWNVADKSSPEELNLHITKPGTSILIILASPYEEIVSGTQYLNLQRAADTKYAEMISQNLEASARNPNEEGLCLDFNGRRISGKKLSGIYQNEPASAEIYPFAVGNRFVTLFYYRADKDIVTGNLFWRDLINSLTFAPSDKKVNLEWIQKDTVLGGIINKKAISLAKPRYLKSFLDVNATGLVKVIVEIDEKGNVVSAQAVSGHPILYAEAESAAKRSKFAPTVLCETAVRLSGTIIYNFTP